MKYELAQTGLAEMRALIFELRPESLEHDGLVCALEARHRLPVSRQLGSEPTASAAVKEVEVSRGSGSTPAKMTIGSDGKTLAGSVP
jgi:hypothetical protein